VKKLLIFIIALMPLSASAGILAELGGLYLSDSLNSGTTSTSSRNFYNLGVLFTINKNIWAGWGYMGVNQSDVTTTTTTFASQDTGPMAKWEIGRAKTFSLTGTFNVLSRANYSSGSTTEKWSGTSLWAEMAFMPEVSEGFHLGGALNYYAASYSKKTVSGTETSTSNSKTWIFPTILMTKSW
jgi:hypothetical protein